MAKWLRNLRRMLTLRQVVTVLALLGLLNANASAEIVTYFHSDNLNSTVIATDQSGATIWTRKYSAYGAPVATTGASGSSLGYAAGTTDPQTGLVYFHYRYYDPTIGRFLSVDPMGFKDGKTQTFNQYAYGNNGPFTYVDPDGRETVFEMIDSNAMDSASDGSGLRTYLWAFAGTAWSLLGAEGVSQVYDKGSNAHVMDYVSAGLEVLAGVTGTKELVAGSKLATKGLEIAADDAARGAAGANRVFWVGKNGELAAKAAGGNLLQPSKAAVEAAARGDWSLMRAESAAFARGATGDAKVFFGDGKGRIFRNDELPELLKNLETGKSTVIDITF